MQSVYLETTIVSYLAGRPSRDIVAAARQQITRRWWKTRRKDFEVFVSQAVVDEAGDGDKHAAARRLELLFGYPLLEITNDAEILAESIIEKGLLPVKAAADALHLAIAAFHRIDFLLTWNCKHLANAEIIIPVNAFLDERGYKMPYICTPDELMEQSDV